MHSHDNDKVMLLAGVPFTKNNASRPDQRFVSPEGEYQLWTMGVGRIWWTNVWERQPDGKYMSLEPLDVNADNYLDVIYQFLRQRGYAPFVASHRQRMLTALATD